MKQVEAVMGRQALAALVLLLGFTNCQHEQLYRLTQEVHPTHYRLDIQPHFQDRNFSLFGQVWIDMKILKDTNNIILHCSKELTILEHSITVSPLQNDTLESLADPIQSLHSQKPSKNISNCGLSWLHEDVIRVNSCAPLKAGERYRLYLRYKGQLSKTLTGFYSSSYFDHKSNQTRWLASTTFEPSEARRVFPCFDEPGFKSHFQVNLARRYDDVALSNMPQRSQHKMNGLEKWVWTRFHQTPAISSYLVAFFVGKLEPRETHTKNGTPFKVWARPAVVSQGKYALDIGPRIIDFFSRLLGVSEPLPKQDVLALPRFIADALENWGLISFGEKHLLYEPGASPASVKKQVAHTLSHEISHSWFGNMVSIRWWDQIWLNEGFATYFATLGANHIEPEWDTISVSAVTAFLHVFSVDSLHTSHPLTVPIQNKHDLRQIFDSVTYYKGFYVLRMLNHSLGESTFLEGCKRYVQRNRYRAVDAQDLWDALTEQSHNDHVLPSHLHLSQLMASWIQEPGFPVLNVTRNYTNGIATISQTRFQRPREDVEGRHKQTAWWIPLTYTTGDDTDFNSTKPRLWMSPDHGDLELKDLPGPEHWLLLNIQAAGLYRVNYDIHNWELIARFLDSPRFEEMAVLNRALILDDALDLARVGLLSYKTALNVTGFLYREQHHLPWKSALSNLGYISRMLRLTDALPSYKQFIQQLIEPQFKKLGFEPHKNDTYLKSLHHKEIVTWACLTGVRSCVQKATDLFKRWSEGQRNVIPRSLRGVVYCTAVEHGGKVEWQKLWEHYKNSSVPSERNSALLALGCTQDIEQLKRYVEWAGQKNSGVKPGDSTTVFKAVASTDAGFGVAKEFLFENVDNILKTVGHFFLPEILETIASRMNQPQHLQELEEFQRKNAAKLQSFTRSVNQMNERVQYNIQWLNNNYEDIHKWLKTRLTAK